MQREAKVSTLISHYIGWRMW